MKRSTNALAVVLSDIFLEHHTPPLHPECKERYEAVAELIQEEKLYDQLLQPRPAARAELLLCHTDHYIELVAKEVASLQPDEIRMLSTGDVFVSKQSFDVALLAVGSVLTAVDAVMKKSITRAFCPVRPPGHHACSNQGMGFCLFNNVAIGARYAQRKYGVKRVLIVDWDVHHGNGTEEIFFDDASIFYFSSHQEGIYPGTGNRCDRGQFNTILNCPIPGGKGSRKKVIQAFQQELVPAMEAFQPEFIFISAGFDSYYMDPLGGFDLTEADFGQLTQIITFLSERYANSRVVSVLEGGYNIQALQRCVRAHLASLK